MKHSEVRTFTVFLAIWSVLVQCDHGSYITILKHTGLKSRVYIHYMHWDQEKLLMKLGFFHIRCFWLPLCMWCHSRCFCNACTPQTVWRMSCETTYLGYLLLLYKKCQVRTTLLCWCWCHAWHISAIQLQIKYWVRPFLFHLKTLAI